MNTYINEKLEILEVKIHIISVSSVNDRSQRSNVHDMG